jgi:hypothetical protein
VYWEEHYSPSTIIFPIWLFDCHWNLYENISLKFGYSYDLKASKISQNVSTYLWYIYMGLLSPVNKISQHAQCYYIVSQYYARIHVHLMHNFWELLNNMCAYSHQVYKILPTGKTQKTCYSPWKEQSNNYNKDMD